MIPAVARAWLAAGAVALIVLSATPGAAAGPTGEKVFFDSLDGTRLSGLLFRPAGRAGSAPGPAIVALHGCSGMLTKSGKLKKRETAWARLLSDAGYTVLFADSFTARGQRGICRLRDRPILPERERPQDAFGALRWLQARPDVAADRVALMGWSNGAMAMLWTVWDGQPAAKRRAGPDFRVAVGFYPGCVQLSKRVADYRPRQPVLIQMGAADNWTLPGPCKALVEAANRRAADAGTPAPMAIDLYPGAYHSFDHPNLAVKAIVTRNSVYASGEKKVYRGTDPAAREAAIRRVLGWLAEKLR